MLYFNCFDKSRNALNDNWLQQSKLVIGNDVLFANVVALLLRGHSVTIPVKGVSMLPFIRGDRDNVVLEPVEACTPEGSARIRVNVGDIVLFRYAGRYILHRILEFDGERAVIQGDGVSRNKEICWRDDICGRVIQIIKADGTVIDPYSVAMRRKLAVWMRLRPFRRYILFIYKRIIRLA